MKIGFYQYDVKHGDKAYNLNKIVDGLSGHSFDLVVLPELFTCGYFFNSREELLPFAEELPLGSTIETLTEISKQSKGCIVSTVPELEDGKLYNTGIVVGESGLIAKQRKIHLSDYEKRLFSSGSEINDIEIKGCKIGIVTCFDSWFPEMCRILNNKGAQILCQPANFGSPWTFGIIKTRAIENQLFTITCNRTGIEYCEGSPEKFRGESRVINPKGDIISQANDVEEGLFLVDIDIDDAKKKSNAISKNFREEWNKYEVKTIKS